MKITFLGAVGEVTGSRFLVEQGTTKILVDCGLFQGPEELAKRNTDPFPVDPQSLDAVILTHAHIDHTGYVPALVKNGFNGPIYCSKGTYALCSLLLIDSGSLQEGEAKLRNQRGGPDHPPAVALYNAQDAEIALKLFKPINYDTEVTIGSLRVTLIRSGHILGSAFVIVSDGTKTLTFSGDLGRPEQYIMKTPPALKKTDYLVIESTYGDRLHERLDTIELIGKVVNATVAKGGMLIIPCFAVGRTETILYCLYQLRKNNIIPHIPIFLDSPMAIKATDLLCKYEDEYTLSPEECREILSVAKQTPTGEDSKKLDRMNQQAIIIAGSGMADGGRVMFHLKRYISDPKNTVLFVGYQAPGTIGNALVTGAKMIKIHDDAFTVQADIEALDTLSAHADYEEILQWMGHFENKIKTVFITHGEQTAAQALQKKIEEKFGFQTVVPNYLESFDLD